MLAYVFWHRPRVGVEVDAYEQAQRGFHASLGVESACFRLEALPFGDRGAGYEDWYLVEDWTALGELNVAAVDAVRRADHDAAAALAGEGWAGVFALVNGPAAIPGGTEWGDKPPGSDAAAAWRRQMVLGPAPEFCLATPASAGRARI